MADPGPSCESLSTELPFGRMAAQQPSIRPWSRLASMAPRPAPIPTPTPQPNPVPQPRPTFTLPTFRPTVPLSMQPQQSAPVSRTNVAPATAAPLTVAPPLAPRARIPPTAVTFTTAPESRSPPVIVTSMPPPPRLPPTAVAPSPILAPPRPSPTTAVSSATPLSPPTAVIPSPPPAAEQLPTTPPRSAITTSPIIRTSPSTLSPSSAALKASPVPTVLPLASSYSVQQSPTPKVSAPFSPLQNSAAPKQVSPVTANTPTASPKFINPHPSTPTPSSEIRPVTHPPSPLTLPPTQIKFETNIPQEEIEQKYVIVQETKENPHKNSNSDQNIFKEKHNGAKRLNSEDMGMGLLTIAGENKGAVMELSHYRKKHDSVNHLQSAEKNSIYSTWREGYKSGSDSSEEGKSKNNGMARRKTTYMNSNVQGVNNSILCNVSYTHRDPGVQYSHSRKANGGSQFHGQWKKHE